jgi:alpha-galactosidase
MKKSLAVTPPMGWNSWDCYGASVTEKEVRGNAEYMAKHLKQYGWEYIVIDIQWYEPGTISSVFRPFVPLEMDKYSRLIPAANKFPSAAEGKGFKPLADYIHGLGLKFGIHIMRGIPRQAVHANTPIKGIAITARDIAHPFSLCLWNTDMYGVDSAKEGAQEYYNSLFELYGSWGVDLVKVDDISNTLAMKDSYSAAGEIELISNAADTCGRDIVISLSCGPSPLDRAEHLKQHANLWRITADFWDSWDDLFNSFEICNKWSVHTGHGHWPDADMLPIGHIGIRSCEHGLGDRLTRLSKNEQVTLMTLWCIFRSPLILGCELRDLNDWTLKLLTNKEILRVLDHSHSARQLFRTGYSDQHIAWAAEDEDGSYYFALFNTWVQESRMQVQLGQAGVDGEYMVRDLWEHEDLGVARISFVATVPSHGAKLLKLSKI